MNSALEFLVIPPARPVDAIFFKPGLGCRLPLVGPGPSQITRREDHVLLPMVRDEFRPAIP